MIHSFVLLYITTVSGETAFLFFLGSGPMNKIFNLDFYDSLFCSNVYHLLITTVVSGATVYPFPLLDSDAYEYHFEI